MNLAASHAADLGKSGITGHTGSDGSSPFDRMNRHGKWLGAAAENIAFGDGTPRDRIIQLIIDDGVASSRPSQKHFQWRFPAAWRGRGQSTASSIRAWSMCLQRASRRAVARVLRLRRLQLRLPPPPPLLSSTPVDKPMEKLAVTPTPAATPAAKPHPR